MIAIPKAAQVAHPRANHAATEIELDADALRAIDAAFPPPWRPEPLAVN